MPSKYPEMAWQVLNAVDFSQTINIARNRCYVEKAWPTAKIIGRKPDESDVIAYGAAVAVLHFAVSYWLDTKSGPAWKVAKIAWHVSFLANTGYHVVNNHLIGLRPFGGGPAVPSYETCKPHFDRQWME